MGELSKEGQRRVYGRGLGFDIIDFDARFRRWRFDGLGHVTMNPLSASP